MKKTIITMFALGLIVSPSFAGSTVANSNNSDTITNYGDTNYDYSSTNNVNNTNNATNYSYNDANSTAYSGSSSTSKSNSNSDSNSTSNSSATGGNSTSSSSAVGGSSTNSNESKGGNSSVIVRTAPSAPPAVAPTVVGAAGTNSVSGGVSTILGGVSGGVSITTKVMKRQIEATTTAIDIQNLQDLDKLDPDTAAKIKRSILRRYK